MILKSIFPMSGYKMESRIYGHIHQEKQEDQDGIQ